MTCIKNILFFLVITSLTQTSLFAKNHNQYDSTSFHFGNQHSGLSLNYLSSKRHKSKHSKFFYKHRSRSNSQHRKNFSLRNRYKNKVTNNYYRKNAYKPQYHLNTKPCHKVNKRYGHKSVGATMCYDAKGNGYIVKGSRYNLHWYLNHKSLTKALSL